MSTFNVAERHILLVWVELVLWRVHFERVCVQKQNKNPLQMYDFVKPQPTPFLRLLAHPLTRYTNSAVFVQQGCGSGESRESGC
jgi:hypothetical protein